MCTWEFSQSDRAADIADCLDDKLCNMDPSSWFTVVVAAFGKGVCNGYIV